MRNSNSSSKRVVIIGGGIAGLSAAYSLRESACANNIPLNISLFEAQSRLGGKIITEHQQGFTIEGGPDSVIRQKPWAEQLAKKLGIGSELIGTNDERRKTYVLNHGRLTPLPDGVMLIIPTRIWPFVTTTLISWPGKIRMGMDFFIPRRKDDSDESVGDFVRRRLGTEALNKIAEPLMGGIHVSDPETQSILGTFPRFRELEKKYGSLIRGMLAQRRAAAKMKAQAAAPNGSNGHGANGSNGHGSNNTGLTSAFITLRGGLGQLVDALEKALASEDIHTGARVTRVEPLAEGGYRVSAGDGTQVEADAIIMTSPAFISGDLVKPFAPELARVLASIRYVSTATVSLAYRLSDVGREPQGFGLVVPAHEKRRISACTWTSTKFNYRAPEDGVLLRCFVGGPGKEEMVDLSDDEMLTVVRQELADLMGIKAGPLFTKIYRWHKANPQYAVGHLERIKQIHALCQSEAPGVYVAGGAYDGVGVPDCIHQGEQAAGKVIAFLQQESKITAPQAVS